MKKLLLLLLPMVAMALTLNSCTKDDGGDDNGNTDIGGSGNGSERLVKSITAITTDSNETVELRYDNQNRIVQAKGIFDGRNMDYTIDYNDKSSIAILHDNSQRIEFVMIYDSDGNIIQTRDGYDTQYEYSDGYFSGNGCTWLDGKIVYLSFSGRVDSWHDELEYNNIEHKLNIGFPFIGSFTWNNYLINKVNGAYPQYCLTTATSLIGDDVWRVTSYQYFFDTEGYPTKIIRTPGISSYSDVTYTFTYY
jgi:hypothetical protein